MKTNAEKCHILVIVKRTVFLNNEGLIIKNKNKENLSGIATDTKNYFESRISYLCKKAIQTKLRSTCKSCKLYNRFMSVYHLSRYFTTGN